MDFGQILHTAQKNERNNNTGVRNNKFCFVFRLQKIQAKLMEMNIVTFQVRYYSTKFEPPKKEKKSSRDLSANIKKFLARKAEEEKKKAEEDNKRRDELLALRSQVTQKLFCY